MTKTQILNRALVHCGQPRVLSFDSPGTDDVAATLNDLYDGTKELVLSSYPFIATLARVELEPDTETPDFYYSYQFTLPNDFLYFISLGEDDPPDDDYRLEGDKVLATWKPLQLRYVKNVADSKLPAYVAEVISLYLAMMICMTVTGNDSNLRNQLFGNLRERWSHAKTFDGKQQKKAQVVMTDLLEQRLGEYTQDMPYQHKGLVP
jgi:hypothetical protein